MKLCRQSFQNPLTLAYTADKRAPNSYPAPLLRCFYHLPCRRALAGCLLLLVMWVCCVRLRAALILTDQLQVPCPLRERVALVCILQVVVHHFGYFRDQNVTVIGWIARQWLRGVPGCWRTAPKSCPVHGRVTSSPS